MTNSRAVACEIFSAAVCNMDCRYCFIPKTSNMVKLHEEAIRWLETGKFCEDLKAVYGDGLEHIGLWGTEPTLTLDLITTNVERLVKEFNNLKEISFSTNLLSHPDRIVKLAEVWNSQSRNVCLDVQISLDGPEGITDINRKLGATERILTNYRSLLDGLDRLDLKSKVKLHFKSTLSIENIKVLNNNPGFIEGWFRFFDDLFDYYVENVQNKKNINLGMVNAPTLVVPGTYSSEDGKELARFFDLCWELELRNKQERIFKHIRGSLNTYVMRFKRIARYYRDFPRNPAMFTCSGGDSNFGLDWGGNVHICHRSFYLNRPEYIEAIKQEYNTDNWDVSLLEYGLLDKFTENFIVNTSDSRNMSRLLYIMRNYHDFYKMQVSYVVAMLKELAMCGQVSKAYLDDDLAVLFAVFVNTCLSCPAENLINTGCVHYTPVSLLRLFGNGAFERVLEQYIRTEGR